MPIINTHSNRGRHLEKLIDLSNGRGVQLERMGLMVQYLPGGKSIVKKGPVDYGGTVIGSGRAIWFDAKMCESPTRFPLNNEDHLPRHQKDFLTRQGQAGAISGLLIEASHSDLGMIFWLPWQAVRSLADPSMTWEAVTHLGIDVGNSDAVIDWMKIVEFYRR
jgi:penicillin-binding protein-related factor A (putative recombinase)